MNVAIDFDKTYDSAPLIFDEVICSFRQRKHGVYIVTYRHKEYDPDPLLDALQNNQVPIIYTDGKAKDKFCKDLGVTIDIWIEDNPKAVHQDSAWQHDSPELHAWREENKARLEDQTLKVA